MFQGVQPIHAQPNHVLPKRVSPVHFYPDHLWPVYNQHVLATFSGGCGDLRDFRVSPNQRRVRTVERGTGGIYRGPGEPVAIGAKRQYRRKRRGQRERQPGGSHQYHGGDLRQQ